MPTSFTTCSIVRTRRATDAATAGRALARGCGAGRVLACYGAEAVSTSAHSDAHTLPHTHTYIAAPAASAVGE